MKNMLSKIFIFVLVLSLPILSLSSSLGADFIANGRGKIPLNEETMPARMSKVNNSDIKQQRAYPMQPPLIPHHIRGYQIDLKTNKCMSCHARKRTAESQAPMVSVTHYMDRHGNFLAEISPRRYFCLQCHVTQQQVPPLIENTFIDMDHLLQKPKGQ